MKTLVGQLTQQMNLVGRLGKPSGGGSDGTTLTASYTENYAYQITEIITTNYQTVDFEEET